MLTELVVVSATVALVYLVASLAPVHITVSRWMLFVSEVLASWVVTILLYGPSSWRVALAAPATVYLFRQVADLLVLLQDLVMTYVVELRRTSNRQNHP